MNSDKKSSINPAASMPALKIGGRVRCTDDGVEGRIVWCNAVSVKIKWEDGEQVTWRRDSLSDRPIEILDAAGDEGQPAAPDAPEQPVAQQPVDPAAAAPPPAEQHSEPPPAVPTGQPVTGSLEPMPAVATQAEFVPPAESDPQVQKAPEQTDEEPETTSPALKPPRAPKTKQAVDDGKQKRLSALDAAAKVLAETGRPMACQDMIGAMGEKGYWKSPGGKTPAATLYSAMLREITTKGATSRFVKAERGKFALRANV
jgi:hypothetical protein